MASGSDLNSFIPSTMWQFLGDPKFLFGVFVALTVVQYLVESTLSRLNRTSWFDAKRQAEARESLQISDADLTASLAYAEDRFRFDRLHAAVDLWLFVGFLSLGGFGWLDQSARLLVSGVTWLPNDTVNIATGLIFFALLGLLQSAIGMPWSWYRIFTIEERHGFNRQTPKGFFLDALKGAVLAIALGAPLLGILLWFITSAGPLWWLYAFLVVTLFSVIVSWAYPVLIAPLFNKFTPLEAGSLREGIDQLAAKIGFSTNGIFVMDASRRSSHGNAYFTGLFGKKRIVLFDTLVKDLSANEVVAVLAHELGHFKLHHVRKGLIRGIIFSFVTFYLLGLVFPLEPFYRAFHFDGLSAHAGLVVFSAWSGLMGFWLQPWQTWISRKHEFEADRFAASALGSSVDLANALRVLREKSRAMPFAHPYYSAWYYSHPPMVERIRVLKSL